jgi:DNA-binding NarL/FixJ family response regulator
MHILVVDDHALFREGVARMLSDKPDFNIFTCSSIREALQFVSENVIDVVLLDHDLGNERASQFLPAATDAGFTGKVLIVTAWVSSAEAHRLLRQGVAGVFDKQLPLTALVETICALGSGSFTGHQLSGNFPGSFQTVSHQAAMFNDIERKVLRLLLEGSSNKEIAARLKISNSYAKAILQRIFNRTGVRTRGQLVRLVLEEYNGVL